MFIVSYSFFVSTKFLKGQFTSFGNFSLINRANNCNVVFNDNKMSCVYFACQLSNAHKLPFDSLKIVYSFPFKLVVSDVWGPVQTRSDGFLYYVSFVDMYKQYIWLYFLKTKSEVSSCFFLFNKFVQVQFGCSIKTLQSD